MKKRRAMRAVRLIEQGRPLESCQLEIPLPGPRHVLVRVAAAGICHSDVHYRSGARPLGSLPVTPGHEVAGTVEVAGAQVGRFRAGDRVCLHYMITCGHCPYCHQGQEQFCPAGEMLGKDRDGGFAEYLSVPARSVFPLPDEIPFEHAAVMMCSSATSLHALRKARLTAGETIAVFGLGGLGLSAVQLARAYGARQVFGVDIRPPKLRLAERYGATPLDAREVDPVEEIKRLTGGRGVDVALELIGQPQTMRQSVRSLALRGRAAIAGLGAARFEIVPFDELLCGEREIIGVSDHLAQEIPMLIELARSGRLDLSQVVTRRVPLDAGAVNSALDKLEQFSEEIRTVILPHK